MILEAASTVARLAAIQRVRQAHADYQAALAAERRMRKPMQALTVDVRRAVMRELSPSGFPDFGWKTPRKPGPKTVASKLAGVEKRDAKKRQSWAAEYWTDASRSRIVRVERDGYRDRARGPHRQARRVG